MGPGLSGGKRNCWEWLPLPVVLLNSTPHASLIYMLHLVVCSVMLRLGHDGCLVTFHVFGRGKIILYL